MLRLSFRPFVALLLLPFLSFACTAESSPETLQEGNWTGGLTPMNHPEMVNPVTYEVRRKGEAWSIDIIGPGGTAVSAQEIRITPDTLFFSFDEPEESVPLACALAKEETHYAGRCTDESGKWAHFTMSPPAE